MYCKADLKTKAIIQSSCLKSQDSPKSKLNLVRLVSLVAIVACVATIPWATSMRTPPMNTLNSPGSTDPKGSITLRASRDNPLTNSVTAITVTNTNNNGPGSLRQAIIDAVSGDIINFNISASDPGCSGGMCTITLVSELVIDKDLMIQGPGANQLTVSGNHAVRVFNIAVGNFKVTLSNLTIANGIANGGGGISNNSTGTLNVIDTTLSGSAALACGGPIFDNKGGGAISNVSTGTLNVLNSTLSGNTACVLGGGIYNANTGPVNITGSTFSGNSAPGSCGGGIYNGFGVVTIVNSTFSGNSNTNAPGGGAICNDTFGGALRVTNSTIAGNSGFAGGGIINISGGTAVVENTIIARNTASNSSPDVKGALTSQGYNLIGVQDGSTGFVNGVNNDQVGAGVSPIDPLLAPLANNGGPTQTRALLAGSPAIDKGGVANNPSTGVPITNDQRGLPRTVDDPLTPNAAGGDGSDIGAFEAQSPPGPTPTPTPTPTPPATVCVQPPPGSIAWWSLDETSGTIAADRVGNHPGAHANGPVPAEGKVRGALRFNGSNHVAVADSDQWAFGSDDFTIDLWANWDVPGSGSIGEPGDILIGSDEGPGNRNKWFFALGGGVLDFTVYNVNSPPSNFFLVRAPFLPIVGQWYHLALTKRGTLFTIFVNGIAVGSEISTSPIANANAPLTIGQAENIGFMNGRLDEVSIYNRALTQEELKAIYDAGSAGKCINLSIRPDRGGDTGSVSVHINGTGFAQGATVKLVRGAESDILSNRVTVGIGGTTIDTTFDLQGKTRGVWDVKVTNPDSTSFILPNGFTIEEGRESELWADVVGLDLIRPGRAQTYWLTYGNRGNIDIFGGHLFLGVPAGIEYRIGDEQEFTLLSKESVSIMLFTRLEAGAVRFVPVTLRVPLGVGSVDLRAGIARTLNTFLDIGSRFEPFTTSALSMPSVLTSSETTSDALSPSTVTTGPGQLGGTGYVHYFVIKKPDGKREYQVGIELSDGTIAWSFPEFGVVISPFIPSGGLLVNGREYQVEHLYGIRPFQDDTSMLELQEELFDRVVPWVQNRTPYCNPSIDNTSNPCISCIGFLLRILFPGNYPNFAEVPDDLKKLEPDKGYSTDDLLLYMLGLHKLSKEEQLKRISELNLPESLRRRLVQLITSFDPNDKVGSHGAGVGQYLSGEDPLRYTVFFENLETAAAPAQEVIITDQLDTVNMDLSTLSLGPISFGNKEVIPPPGASTFATNVDLRPDKNLIVRVTTSLNPNTGLLTWRFASIDPTTGNPPEDPLVGFLPPNVNPPEGDGSVLFTVMPKKGVATGTEIRNKARIIFDANEPIDTPEWFNTIDNSKPTSNVLPLTASQCATDLQVQWAGTDEGSGIANYTIAVSDNGGSFTVWQQNTKATSGMYTGQFGHTYAFYSVAQDKTGNLEDAPTNPDATVTLTEPAPPTFTSVPATVTAYTGQGATTCGAFVSDAILGTATAQSACSSVNVTRSGVPSGNIFPVGQTTITYTATDGSGNSTTATQTVTVIDNTPPTITAESASPISLWPPNHTMRDVFVNYTAMDNCSSTCTLSVTSNEPVNGTGDGDTAPDWEIIDPHHVRLGAERAAIGNGRIYMIAVTCTDSAGNSTSKDIAVFVAHNIAGPTSGAAFKIGTTVNFSGTFWDLPGRKHTAQWIFDDTLSTIGNVVEPSGSKSGTVTGAYTFTTPGVYKIKLKVTDNTGQTSWVDTAGDTEAIVVIYDPNGGYTIGGGYISVLVGSYPANPSKTGKLSFGFNSKYTNATNPKGETQIQFAMGGLEFNALNYDYLAISSARAQFRGFGKLNGESGYNFILTVIDGQLTGGGGVDKFRIKIWNKTTGAIVFDSQMGESDAVDPSTPVGTGSSIVIQK